MTFCFAFEMGSSSSSFLVIHQHTCLKDVRTLEHTALAEDKFAYHPERFFHIHRLQFGEMVVLHVLSKSFPILDNKNTNNQVLISLRK